MRAKQTKQATRHRKFADQCFVVNLLPDELVLAERVASFSCDGVNGSLLHLLLDGTVQHEQRLSSTLLVREEAALEAELESFKRLRFSFGILLIEIF